MQASERLACLRVDDLGVEADQRDPIATLVLDIANAVLGADRGLKRQRPVQSKALLAVHDPSPRNFGSRIGVPEGRPAQGDAHARNWLLSSALESVKQFVLVQRVIADAKAQGVQGSVAPVVALLDRRNAAAHYVIEVHRLLG